MLGTAGFLAGRIPVTRSRASVRRPFLFPVPEVLLDLVELLLDDPFRLREGFPGGAQGIQLNVDVLADRHVVLVLQMRAAAHPLKRQVHHGLGPGNAGECSEDNREVVRFKAHRLTDMAAV